MRILIIGIDGVSLEQILDDEHLTHLRWLLGSGCYGRLGDSNQPAFEIVRVICDQIASAGQRVQTAATLPTVLPELQQVHDLVLDNQWICVQIALSKPDVIQEFDTELVKLLESLDNDTAIMIVPAYQAKSGFILAVPNNLLHGEIEDANLLDLAPTLLELAGASVPDSLQGRSLVAEKTLNLENESGYSQDEEAMVRERLEGLGYI